MEEITLFHKLLCKRNISKTCSISCVSFMAAASVMHHEFQFIREQRWMVKSFHIEKLVILCVASLKAGKYHFSRCH